MKKSSVVATQIGKLVVVANQDGIEAVGFPNRERDLKSSIIKETLDLAVEKKINSHIFRAEKQLKEYFEGKRQNFDLDLAPTRGTPFQKRVWKALCGIPFGQTRSYADVALKVGSPKAMRAVGLANKRNPIAIIVPCHRVIGKSGALVGYDGGLHRKTKLLKHEGAL